MTPCQPLKLHIGHPPGVLEEVLRAGAFLSRAMDTSSEVPLAELGRSQPGKLVRTRQGMSPRVKGWTQDRTHGWTRDGPRKDVRLTERTQGLPGPVRQKQAGGIHLLEISAQPSWFPAFLTFSRRWRKVDVVRKASEVLTAQHGGCPESGVFGGHLSP